VAGGVTKMSCLLSARQWQWRYKNVMLIVSWTVAGGVTKMSRLLLVRQWQWRYKNVTLG
jgi:hypothetical protein